jgi:phosphoribosylformylglycinamidine cyclo-ligase
LNYYESGVNIPASNKFIDHIFSKTEQNKNSRVLSTIGGFNALFDISHYPVANPVLVSSTDGVGSKLELSLKFDRLETIGIDLVAMVVNDIIVCGAKPLFFLDYYATGKLDNEKANKILEGILVGCEQAKIPLLGGETAEMPTLYSGDTFDLAGFGIGIVNREQIIKPELVKNGDVIVGLISSGVHSNGFSLINKTFDFNSTMTDEFIDELLAPTKIYVDVIEELVREVDVHGIAHITGGGIPGNLIRVLPEQLSAQIYLDSWKMQDIFLTIKKEAQLTRNELLETFNCGIGMCIIVDESDLDRTFDIINECGEFGLVIGYVVKNSGTKMIYSTIYGE